MASPDPITRPREQARLFESISTEQAFGEARSDEDAALHELADVALEAARSAATILLAGARRPATGVTTKVSQTDMVTDTDRASEEAVSRVISQRRPDDGVLAEEGTAWPGRTGVRWVVDPLDGTTNFLFGVPQFSVSIAAEIDGQGVVGVVVDPIRDETWAAVRGRGSRVNGVALRGAREDATIGTALVATGFGYRSEDRQRQALVASRVIPVVRDIRRFGSAALDLCWTAGGRFDAYYEWGLNAWDLTAGRLIVAESGQRIEVLAGRLVVAAGFGLFDQIVNLLASAGGFSHPR
jgi:myo-inositol-1(or 4)-monophosphatase